MIISALKFSPAANLQPTHAESSENFNCLKCFEKFGVAAKLNHNQAITMCMKNRLDATLNQ